MGSQKAREGIAGFGSRFAGRFCADRTLEEHRLRHTRVRGCRLFHRWNGCTCRVCGSQRNAKHEWDGCKCRSCGVTRDVDDDWDHCTCRTCAKCRNSDHDWDGCKCRKCGVPVGTVGGTGPTSRAGASSVAAPSIPVVACVCGATWGVTCGTGASATYADHAGRTSGTRAALSAATSTSVRIAVPICTVRQAP